MGEPATWTPAAGGDPLTGRVLFKAPDRQQALMMGIEYSDMRPEAEYYAGTFPGLKESADGHTVERLEISGVGYWVQAVDRLADGKTLRAVLTKDAAG